MGLGIDESILLTFFMKKRTVIGMKKYCKHEELHSRKLYENKPVTNPIIC